jgi:hypothetical protein
MDHPLLVRLPLWHRGAPEEWGNVLFRGQPDGPLIMPTFVEKSLGLLFEPWCNLTQANHPQTSITRRRIEPSDGFGGKNHPREMTQPA